ATGPGKDSRGRNCAGRKMCSRTGRIWPMGQGGDESTMTEPACAPETALRSNLVDSGRVLVVDDERDIREGCAAVLRACGFPVDEAADGANAVRLLGAHVYDAILSDIAMPGMDGMMLLRAVR